MEEYIAMYVRTYRILKGVAERLREDSSESGWFAGHACGGDEALAEQGLSDKELVLTEWNATACQVLDDDTVYKAAYLAKTIADTVEEPDVSPVLFFALAMKNTTTNHTHLPFRVPTPAFIALASWAPEKTGLQKTLISRSSHENIHSL